MTVIKVENLGKRYLIGHDKKANGAFKYNSMRDSIYHSIRVIYQKIRHPLSPNRENITLEEFWALQDINFEINQGDKVGIIGPNGAGKTTLLKLLSRITQPTTGSIKIKGRIASLLEVGTGFHQELSGRENIYLNGAILGMKRVEIKKKFDEIVAFAEVEKFLDTPVKRYSSGMYVRLAFAVAAHLEPEILIVDEVLAVGDAAFQKKSLGKMEDVSKEGRTVIFVSHNMAAIKKLCSKIIILEHGKLSYYNSVETGIKRYLQSNIKKSNIDIKSRKDRKGNGTLRFIDLKYNDLEDKEVQSIQSGSFIRINLHIKTDRTLNNVIFRISFADAEGYIKFVCNNFHSGEPLDNVTNSTIISCVIEKLPLNHGLYYLHLQCLVNKELADEIEYVKEIYVEKGDFYKTGKHPFIKTDILVEHDWEIL